MKNIVTGVDKLLQLLETKKKIDLDSAARELNLGKEVVQEWTDLLESEDMITVTNKFSKTWIEPKKITIKRVKETAKEIVSERDAVARKIEIAIKKLEKDTVGFSEIKNEFISIQSHIKNELDIVKKELGELEHYDSLRHNIDKDIETQRETYQKLLKAYDSQTSVYEERHKKLLFELDKNIKKTEQSEQTIKGLKSEKLDVEKAIQQSTSQLKTISNNLDKEIKDLITTEKALVDIKKNLETLKLELEGKKDTEIKELAKRLGMQTEHIADSQNELLENAKLKIKEIKDYADSGRRIYQNFDGMIMKRIKTEELIENIDKERKDLTKELQEMLNKVNMFSIMSKSPDVKQQMHEIENEVKKIEVQKTGLIKKINSLVDFIKNN